MKSFLFSFQQSFNNKVPKKTFYTTAIKANRLRSHRRKQPPLTDDWIKYIYTIGHDS